MQFSQQQIDLALEMKRLGLDWEPAVGHYVYDRQHIVDRPSPFQPRVYFVLNFDHFIRLVGGVERFRTEMAWLPTWEDAREILAKLGVSDADLQRRLMEVDAIGRRVEMDEIYRAIRDRLAAGLDRG
jgi:hypothetical protein